MPIFSDRNVDVGGVERRGRGGVALGGGLGGVGLLVYLVISLLGGGNPGAFLVPDDTQVAGTGESVEELRARCNADGALERHDDCYLIKIYNEINEIWAETIPSYERPRLAFYEQGVSTGCGNASSEVGPFYCPPDREIFIDIGFLEELQRRFGATGRYAQAYIMAHESGHHLQTLFGDIDRDRSREGAIALELQADCYAGAWSRLANEKGNVAITEAELDEALEAAAAVGDDRIQQKTQGRVDPESWTHGSAAQRREAFRKGFTAGDPAACRR
jgi:uncharacterized protein